MPWVTLTEDDVYEIFSAQDLKLLRQAQQAPGHLDPLPGIIAKVCSEVHGYVATRYAVGQPGTIPEQLVSAAAAIARWRLLGSMPIKQLSTEHRKGEYEDGMARLREVSKGTFVLDVPTSPATEQPGQSAAGAWGSQKDF